MPENLVDTFIVFQLQQQEIISNFVIFKKDVRKNRFYSNGSLGSLNGDAFLNHLMIN